MSGAGEGALRSEFASTTGGVMTEDAGAITGDLELLTRPVGGLVEAFVRYAGADEWHRVAGAPVRALGAAPNRGEHEQAHEAILARVTTPGPVADGNEMPVDLLDG